MITLGGDHIIQKYRAFKELKKQLLDFEPIFFWVRRQHQSIDAQITDVRSRSFLQNHKFRCLQICFPFICFIVGLMAVLPLGQTDQEEMSFPS